MYVINCKTIEVCEVCGEIVKSITGAEIAVGIFFGVIISLAIYLAYSIDNP